MAFQRIHLIINPASGQPQPILHTVNRILHEHDVDWHVSVTTSHANATDLTRKAVDDGADLIVAYGGDGTVMSIANGLVKTDIPLALLHGGTGNAMAHQLGIPVDIAEALELAFGEHTLHPIDLGRAEVASDSATTRHFLLRASAGFQHTLLEGASRDLKTQFGNLAYVVAGLKSLTAADTLHFRLTIDDQQIAEDALMCLVVNSAAVGGPYSFEFAPGVDCSDGYLDVFLIGTDFESVVSLARAAMSNDVAEYPMRWRGREISLEVDPPQPVSIDGEPFAQTPFLVRAVPGAIRVIVPKNR